MQTDYSNDPLPTTPSFLALPLVTQAIALHLRDLAEPVHGSLAVRAAFLIEDFRQLTDGINDDEEAARLSIAIRELQQEGYLTRCRFLDAPFEQFPLADGRNAPLSHWVVDPDGPCLVITDWVPSTHGFTAVETKAWHELREDRHIRILELAS